MDPLRFVKFFATIKHGEQRYASTLPYTHHLAAVEAVVWRFKDSLLQGLGVMDANGIRHAPVEDVVAALETFATAAWLHDLIEDTRKSAAPVKRKDIAEMFGERVAELVEAVTDEVAENRKARKALTYPKIRACKGAVALKLADRIANVEHGGGLGGMYRKEQEDFKRNLYTPGEYEAMWQHLDGLLA